MSRLRRRGVVWRAVLEDLHRCDGIGFVPTELTRTTEAKQARLAQGLDGVIQTAEFF
jgi:hypothetical protein